MKPAEQRVERLPQLRNLVGCSSGGGKVDGARIEIEGSWGVKE